MTVSADVLTAETSTAAAQLLERRPAPVISDNMGAQEMKQHAEATRARLFTVVILFTSAKHHRN